MFRPTLARLSRADGHHGIHSPSVKPKPQAYRSPYGPNYKVRRNLAGIDIGRAYKFATTAGLFAIVAGAFSIQMFADVPKVRTEICAKLPIVGDYFIREIPPEDNPF